MLQGWIVRPFSGEMILCSVCPTVEIGPLLCVWGEEKRVGIQRLGHFQELLPRPMSVPKSKRWMFALTPTLLE